MIDVVLKMANISEPELEQLNVYNEQSGRQPNLHFNSCDFRPDIRVGAYLNVKRLIYDVNVINVFHQEPISNRLLVPGSWFGSCLFHKQRRNNKKTIKKPYDIPLPACL